MEKATEIFETWFTMQKEVMENWTKVQKEFMENWTESSKKFQESFVSMGAAQGDGKDILKMYSSWFNTMVDSSRIFTDEAIKIQETWKASVEKQMEMSKEMLKGFSEVSKQKAA